MKSDLDRHIEKHIKDKEFKIYFDKADAKRRIAQEIAALRSAKHLTQTQLAEEVGTRQQVISRLENPADMRMPSFEFLDRIAKAFNKRLVVSLE
ncbi:helix-turn-helix transcriptional regulator [Candidatus Amesbacteria bacterium]|nr:helix-turn-helix transcriptional regulator [Candidatus Amesbacteria bacterium]